MKTLQAKSVENVVYQMLKENTGVAMMDSGGTNGRQWQRNKAKTLNDFRKEDQVSWDQNGGFYTISVFHHLVNGLELDGICQEFNSEFVPTKDWDSDLFYGVSAAGQEWIESHGFEVEATFNTYNEDSNLSQILQGTWLTFNDESYLLLQVHGGCDARGGYTDARLFYVPGRFDGALLEDVYGTVTKADGTTIEVDNRYNGHSLTTEHGDEVEITEKDQVELWIMEI